MRISQLKQAVIQLFEVKLVPFIQGSPGLGKSGIIHEIAKEYSLKVIDLRLSQCDPTDLAGFPSVVDGRSRYLPMEHFPLASDPKPKGMNGWILFLDEMNSASPAVQASAYKLVLDRMVGTEHLHEDCYIVAAGNRETDGAIVESMSTALQSRLVHLDLEVNNDDWLKWAIKSNVDSRILSYLQFRPNDIYTFRADHTDKTYACPRTWEFANRIIQQPSFDPNSGLSMDVLSGTLGMGVAHPFLVFCKIKTHTIEDILKSPETISVPTDISIVYSLIGSIAQHINEDNVTDLMKFITRLPNEFVFICMRESMFRNNKLTFDPAFAAWVSANLDKLL